jgi:hypothetical protein
MGNLEILSKLDEGAIKPAMWAMGFGRQDSEVLKKNDMAILLSAKNHGLEEDNNLELHWKNMTWNRRGAKTETATYERKAESSLSWTLHS